MRMVNTAVLLIIGLVLSVVPRLASGAHQQKQRDSASGKQASPAQAGQTPKPETTGRGARIGAEFARGLQKADQLARSGHPKEAIEVLRETVDYLRESYPPAEYPDGHLKLAVGLNSLAMLLQSRAEYAEAELLYREALAMNRRLYPAERYPDGRAELAISLNNLGTLLQARGDYAGAEALLRESLTIKRRLFSVARFPLGHPDLANSLNNLGVLLETRGDIVEAEQVHSEALSMYRRLFPAARFPIGHVGMAASLNNLGWVLAAKGDLAGAERLLSEALAMMRRIYPPARFPEGHAELAKSLDRLGMLLKDKNDYARAEPLLSEAVAMNRRLYPPGQFPEGHAQLARILNHLGTLLLARGDYGGAERLLSEALAMLRRLYPPARFPEGHAELATSLNRLGMLLKDKNDYARAEPLLSEALAIMRRLFPKARYPEGHAELASILINLGILLKDKGDYAGAEPHLKEALAMSRRVYSPAQFPEGHAQLAKSLNNLAGLLLHKGDDSGAEPLLNEALAMDRRLYPEVRYPEGHAQLASSLNNLGMLLEDQGDYVGAEPHLKEALAMRRRVYPETRYPEGHADLATSLNNLGMLLSARGDYAGAEQLFRDTLAMNRRLYPEARFPGGHPRLNTPRSNLALLLQARGDYGGAEPLLTESFALDRRLYPKDRYPDGHPQLATGLNNLGSLLKDKGDHAGAEALFREGLAMDRRLYPKDRYPDGHARLATGLNNLGTLLRDKGDYSGAEPLLNEALAMDRRLYPEVRYPDGHEELARGLSNFGSLLAARGDWKGVEPLARDAKAMLQRLTDRESDVLSFAESLNLVAKQPGYLSGLLTIHRRLPQDATLYDVVWNAKGSLTRLLERRHRDLLAVSDPEAGRLAIELNKVRLRLAQVMLRPDPDPREVQDKLAKLTAEKERLEREIARKLGIARRVSRDDRSATPQGLRESLPQDTVFIDLLRNSEYHPGAVDRTAKWTGFYTAFLVSRSRPPQRVELGEAAAIDTAWAAWRIKILDERTSLEEERRSATELSRLTWDKLRAKLPPGTKAVYLSPDGVLTQIPFAALPGSKPGTVLIEDMAVAVVPHGPFLLERLSQPRQDSKARAALVVGGVDYGGASPQVPANRSATLALEQLPLREGRGVSWKALPGTAIERDAIGTVAQRDGLLEVHTLSQREASTDRVLAELPRARFAHLATHGFFADPKFRSALQLDPNQFLFNGRDRATAGGRNPLVLSGLVFAGANRTGPSAAPDRGIVTAEAIIGLNLDSMDLAVLSACDTGLGDVAGGEGVLGLVRALHVAGCRDVIASLWSVEDQATAALMTLFYRKLWHDHLPAPEALRQAQLAIYHHPDLITNPSKLRDVDFTERPIGSSRPAVSEPVAAPGPRAKTAQWAAFTFSGVANPGP
jgi:CHAT domain-containing protein/tetratricopeptide (TPR) repeat protein